MAAILSRPQCVKIGVDMLLEVDLPLGDGVLHITVFLLKIACEYPAWSRTQL